jgi:hypothetical protein
MVVFPLGIAGRDKKADLLPGSDASLLGLGALLPDSAALLPGSAAGLELTICCEGAQVAKSVIWAPQSITTANKFFISVPR